MAAVNKLQEGRGFVSEPWTRLLPELQPLSRLHVRERVAFRCFHLTGRRFDSRRRQRGVLLSNLEVSVLLLYELLLVAVTHFHRSSESAEKPQQILSP